MLVKVDAQQLEWRVAAWLSNDQTAIREILEKIDFHEENQHTFGLPSRLIAKIYLFRTIFRGSGYAFSVDPQFMHVSDSPEFWDEVGRKFYKKYNGLDRWHNQLARLSASRRPIVSPLGREWLVLPKDDGKLRWTVFTNYPVQGTGADLMMIARLSLARRLRAANSKALLISTVHDDIKLDVPDSETEFVTEMALQVFDDLPKNVKAIFGVDLPIPFSGEAFIGRDLLNMEKYVRH